MESAGSLNGGFQPGRYRPGGIGNWSGHLPFARDLVNAAKPSLFVELGAHYGESYFGFCQAVRENHIDCSCYAVDTWVGETQAGFYDESVYAEVHAYNSAHYSDFSYLLRSTFDDALLKFTDESIELLHIDGLHSYGAVCHDLRSWLTKVRPGGIVLLHDIMVRHADFGVWKLWEELATTGQQFAFRHDWGLGVFRKAGSALPDNNFLTLLFDSPPELKEHVRKFYSLCAIKLEHEHEGANAHGSAEGKLVVQVYPFGGNGYSAESAMHADVQSGRWEHLSVSILQGAAKGALRIDPAGQPGLIDVSAVLLRRPADGEILWSLKGADEVSQLAVGGTLIRLRAHGAHDYCRFFSHGSDPQLFLPLLDPNRFDQPLQLELWLRVDTDMGSLLPALNDSDQLRSHIQTLEAAALEVEKQAESYDVLFEEARRTHADERNALTRERDALIDQRSVVMRQQEALAADFRRLQAELYVCRIDMKRKTAEESSLRSELAAAQNVLNQALASHSWRITKPVRMLSELLRRKR